MGRVRRGQRLLRRTVLTQQQLDFPLEMIVITTGLDQKGFTSFQRKIQCLAEDPIGLLMNVLFDDDRNDPFLTIRQLLEYHDAEVNLTLQRGSPGINCDRCRCGSMQGPISDPSDH